MMKKSLIAAAASLILAGCASRPKDFWPGMLYKSSETLTAPKTINGVQLPAKTKVHGLKVFERPRLGLPHEYQIVEVHHRLVVVKKFGDPALYYGVLPANAKDMSTFTLTKAGSAFQWRAAWRSLGTYPSSIEKSGGGIWAVMFNENDMPKAAVLHYRGERVEELPGEWTYWGDWGQRGFSSRISEEEELHRIFREETGTVEPGESSPDGLVGFIPVFNDDERVAHANGKVAWVGVYEKAGQEPEYSVHTHNGKLLSKNRLTGVMVKPFPVWLSYKDNPTTGSALIGKSMDGGYEVFAPILAVFESFKKVGEADSEEKAVKMAEDYFEATNAVAKKTRADFHKRNEEIAKAKVVASENISVALQINPNNDQVSASSLNTWKRIVEHCKAFHWSDADRPLACKHARANVSAMEGSIKSAESAIRKQKADEWKSRQLQFAREKAEWDKQQSQRTNSGASQAVHDQMLRNGYQWVRKKR
jgi:hypothetical protein